MIEVDPDYESVEIAEFSDEFEYRYVNGTGTSFVFDSSIQLKEDDEILSLIDNFFLEQNSTNFNNSIERMRLIMPDLNYNLANATIGVRPDDLFYFSIWDDEEDYDRIRAFNMDPE